MAYGTLAGYGLGGFDHMSTADGPAVAFVAEGAQGLLALTASEGTTSLMSCQDGADTFVSTDAACEGRKVLGSLGRIWTTAPASANRPIYQCVNGGDRFVSLDAACGGLPVDRELGYVLDDVPAVTAVFA
ncbi:hypothetical protein CLV71_102148 [Actinophytocola oryzae]|uniref:Uncharacterized protein n=1 Tax=Actinophytocola oryzae TaxID=502181 RepID=A0A4R7W3B1_9PSEU|nr:hypothetical protein CLV71_102148 [Actinophytocola oryzae]